MYKVKIRSGHDDEVVVNTAGVTKNYKVKNDTIEATSYDEARHLAAVLNDQIEPDTITEVSEKPTSATTAKEG